MARSRAVLVVLGGAVALAAIGAWGVSLARHGETPTDRARRFYLAALEQGGNFNRAGMERDLRLARSADSTYFPALLIPSLLSGPSVSHSLLADLDTFATNLGDRQLATCLRALWKANTTGRWHEMPAATRPSPAARLCLARHELNKALHPGSQRRVELARLLWASYPECLECGTGLLYELSQSSDPMAAVSVATTMIAARLPPQVRAQGYASIVEALHHAGRHEDAIRREREAEADLRGAADGVRLTFAWYLGDSHRARMRTSGTDTAFARHAGQVVESSERLVNDLLVRADALTATSIRLLNAGRLLDDGELEASRSAWDSLARIADRLGSQEFRAGVLIHRGRTLVKLGRSPEAERDLLAGREAARQVDHLAMMYEAEHNLLHLYEAEGRTDAARRAGEAFVALTTMGNNLEVQQMANRDVAWFYQRRGERERARPYFEAVLAFADSLPDQDLQWAGEYFDLIGDLERAESYFNRAEASFRRVGPGREATRVFVWLTQLAEATGDSGRALGYARTHDAALEHASYPEVAPLLPGLLARFGRIREAADELSRARAAAARRGQIAGWATLSTELAALLLRMGEWSAAIAVADSATEAATRVALSDARLRAEVISGLARVHGGRAGRADGVARIQRAMREAERIGPPTLRAELNEWRAEAELAEGREAQALTYLARAADLADSLAVSLSRDPRRAGVRSAHIRISNRALAMIIASDRQSGSVDRWAEWSVRRKSRGVLETGSLHPVSRGTVVHTVRDRLGDRDAVIDYAVLDTTVAALVVTSTGAALHILPVSAESLGARVGRLVRDLAPRMGSVVDTLHARFDAPTAARLYADLFAPLEKELGARNRITIVADGPLHQLPFDALVLPGDDSQHTAPLPPHRFALERFTISFAPSLALAGGGDRSVPGAAVLAFAAPSSGTPLAGAVREVAAVRTAFGPARVRIFSGASASEAAIREHAPAAAVLHIAAHARANDADPASAHIALAPASGSDDGLLHAYEIESLRLAGTLVVLSACETGAGRLLGGEGVLSLSRAFLRAGASATVATLWPVGPSTADLMGRFYHDLAAGVPPARALRNAKLELVRGGVSSPLVWAPFVLVARSR